MGLFDSVTRFQDQDYKALRKQAVTSGALFTDPVFKPEDRSLSTTPGKFSDVVWKRPRELCPTPRLFVGGVNRDDVMQGELGNCWFVAALSCLASVKQYWHKVIPDYKSQEWNPEKPEEYQGIFRFQFWRFGRWTEVVIDDLLPTRNGKLIFTHSRSGGEFWCALLEKAYAKFFGTYESLDGGRLSEGLEDFTGGVSDALDLTAAGVASAPQARADLFTRLGKEMDRNSMMGASIPAESSAEMEAPASNGLVKGHAYGISDVRTIHLKGSGLFSFFNREKLQMIRLRNPWGNKEWTGAFSDGSAEWEKITDSDKKKIGLVKDDDGEFWMTFDDFCQHFKRIDLCILVNTSIFSLSKTWHEGIQHGAWAKPERAGGCSNHPTFLKNPQYMFDVTDDEEEFMVQLIQESSRDQEGSDNKTIGFSIFRVEMNRKYRMHDQSLHENVKTKEYTNLRSVFSHHTLVKKGRYVIVPSTFEPNQDGGFLLRVYTSSSNHFTELTHDVPVKSWWNCCGGRPAMVTHIKVVKAAGLEKQDTHGGADPYCVIVCDGTKVKGRVMKNTRDPEWGDSALFYRKKLSKPITVQVWNHNLLHDQFMGEYIIKSANEEKQKSMQYNLFGRDKESNSYRPGKILVTVTQSRNLYTV